MTELVARLNVPPLTRRRLPVLAVLALVTFALVYVLFVSTPGGSGWRTTNFGSAVHDPASFLRITLDSVTFAAALFIVASGFALIFGLMRIVNMAHGAFYADAPPRGEHATGVVSGRARARVHERRAGRQRRLLDRR